MSDQFRRDEPAAFPISISPDLEEAARVFFPDVEHLRPVGDATHLVRAETPAGSFCVRRWPPGTTVGRIRFVHAALAAARAADVPHLPSAATLPDDPAETVLPQSARLYDAQAWLPGRVAARHPVEVTPNGEHVNLPGALPPGVMIELITTVGKVHAGTARTADLRNAPSAPLDVVLPVVQSAWEAHRERLRPAAPRTPPIQRWVRAGERVLPAAAEALVATAPELRAPRAVVHADLWPAHALTARGEAGERLTGIADWTDAVAGSPLLDLAHLITHFGGWDADAAETAIGAYADAAPLSPDERRLLPAVAALDLIAGAGWLLHVAYGRRDRDDAPATSAARAGAESLVRSLEILTEIVTRGEQRGTSGARKWDYAPRRGSAPRSRATPAARPARPRAPHPARRDDERPRPPRPPAVQRATRPARPARDGRRGQAEG